MNLKKYNLINIKDTEALAEELSLRLSSHLSKQIIFLEGDLGVGKTTLVQYVLKNLGIKERVKSPTYSLIEPYQNDEGYKIYHIDLYRLQDLAELSDLGLIDLLDEPALFLVEWPEKLKTYGIKPNMLIQFKLLKDGTRVVMVEDAYA